MATLMPQQADIPFLRGTECWEKNSIFYFLDLTSTPRYFESNQLLKLFPLLWSEVKKEKIVG